ncbi:hypothetical protein N8I77_007402 [Diaporthe amygdali]|uniref:DUF6594 domain-containing protein n=1 Tax=Phomopsis amygdali TaxID=1214568 RepID=A0AAD9SBZ5_PHOAM|nr:hypothetical protein N8I77_007402 [Diaporthe amygdali]
MEGYAKVARLMAKYEEFAILKRFKALNYQSLLYRQAEITYLQEDLEKLAERDATDSARQYYTKDWWALAHTETKQEGGEQWRKVQQIRKKLDDYNNQLFKLATLAKLDGPAPPDLRFLREWFERRDMGFFPIWGLDKKSWEDEEDLIAIKPRLLQDPITRFFEALISLFHRFLGERLKDPECPELGDSIYHYEKSLLFGAADIFTTVIASLLPMLSIIVLFFMSSNALKLVVITVFSACFSLALALTTNARRIEIFAATAA